MRRSPTDLVRSYISQEGYVYAKRLSDRTGGRECRLASNENPFPPPEEVIAAGLTALSQANRYPDQENAGLADAIQEAYGWDHVVCGVGMDGVIDTVLRTTIEPGDKVAISTPTFSYYRLAALAQGARVVHVRRGPEFEVDPTDFIRESAGAKVAFLCTPNNPSGTGTPRHVIEEVLQRFDGLLFLDNAYVEFSSEDYLPLMKQYDNLLIGRTFSKAYALAGLRVGYAFFPDWLASAYLRAATPHTLNRVSAAVAAAAMRSRDYIGTYISQVHRWRDRLKSECPLPVIPSEANFVMVDVAPRTGDEVVNSLALKGILVRSCRSFPDLPDHYIRVSIGEDWENEAFLSGVKEL